MKTLLIAAGMLTLAAACNKQGTISSKNYKGELVLTGQNNIPLSGKVSIQFTGVSFSGPGDSAVFPFVGAGVFKLQNDSIYFNQTGSVPESVAKGIILEGGFRLEQNADSLVFSHKEPAGSIQPDQFYRLKKQ